MSAGGHDTFDKIHEYGVDLRGPARRVFLFGDVLPSWIRKRRRSMAGLSGDDEKGSTDQVVRNLLALDRLRPAMPIELWINTPGGAMTEMWAVYDVMRTLGTAVSTVAIGEVCSAGCLLLAGGTGTRYALPHAQMMWHAGTDSANDLTPGEFQDRAKSYEQDRARWVTEMARVTGRRAGRSIEQRRAFWQEWARDRENWLDARGMVDHGVVDEIWTGEED